MPKMNSESPHFFIVEYVSQLAVETWRMPQALSRKLKDTLPWIFLDRILRRLMSTITNDSIDVFFLSGEILIINSCTI